MTTLINTSEGKSGPFPPVKAKTSSGKEPRGSKKAAVLVAAVEKAIENFLERGKEILDENQGNSEAVLQLGNALADVTKTGMFCGNKLFSNCDHCCLQRQHLQETR